MTAAPADLPAKVLAAWGLEAAPASPVDAGLINRTFVVRGPDGRSVLQWVNPIFGPEVNEDIEAVTAHLAARGFPVPRLVRTRAGALSAADSASGHWRLMTFVAGLTFHKATGPALCGSAGRLVGRFHRAVADLAHVFAHRRPHVHDTPRHLAHLADVLSRKAGHRNHALVAPVAREILARGADLPVVSGLPQRVVHGDLKLSNLLFSPEGEAIALIDLDTLARMSVVLELGDAWRSWCNPAGEDDPSAARLDLGLFEASVRGYAEGAAGLLEPAELAALPRAVELIALELSARFCADALDESYFGWDRSRFPSASEHNLLRARGQLALARSAAEQRPAQERVVAAAFG
ncbi:MAG: phosphotransferase [Anaeromyxobacter sp.]